MNLFERTRKCYCKNFGAGRYFTILQTYRKGFKAGGSFIPDIPKSL